MSDVQNPEQLTRQLSDQKKSGLLSGVETFDKSDLKPVTTQEKIVIPDKETIELEKKEQQKAE
jgi:hypothetical protein